MAAGDRGGSGRVFDWAWTGAFESAVVSMARRAGVSAIGADDVVQEVRLRFLEGRVVAWDGAGPPRPELVASVARNVAREVRRGERSKTRPLPIRAEEDTRSASGRDSGAATLPGLVSLEAAWPRLCRALTPRQIEAVEFRMAGVGTRRAALRMGIAPATYASLLVRAIRRVRGEEGASSRVREVRPADLASALDHNPRWARALELRLAGRSHAEIGVRMRVSREAARALVRRALQAVRTES